MKKLSKHILLLSLLAFLLNVNAPFFASYNLNTLRKSEDYLTAKIFSGKILICTADGFKFVSLEDIKSGKNLPKHGTKHFECPLCYTAANGYSKASEKITISYFSKSLKEKFQLAEIKSAASSYFNKANSPRAPPEFSA